LVGCEPSWRAGVGIIDGMEAPDVKLLAPGKADDAAVEDVTRVINAAYAIGEAGLWRDGWTRTTPEEVSGLIRDRELLAATVDGRIVGCARVALFDDGAADLGLVSAAPGLQGSGVGRALVSRAEEDMRSRGVTTMQLELLVPCEGTHPFKERLRAWYERLGYRVQRTAPFEEVASHPAADLARPCEFLIYRKALA
jgi:ribosomal protein S18 acetylase RimI-like enzyme